MGTGGRTGECANQEYDFSCKRHQSPRSRPDAAAHSKGLSQSSAYIALTILTAIAREEARQIPCYRAPDEAADTSPLSGLDRIASGSESWGIRLLLALQGMSQGNSAEGLRVRRDRGTPEDSRPVERSQRSTDICTSGATQRQCMATQLFSRHFKLFRAGKPLIENILVRATERTSHSIRPARGANSAWARSRASGGPWQWKATFRWGRLLPGTALQGRTSPPIRGWAG